MAKPCSEDGAPKLKYSIEGRRLHKSSTLPKTEVATKPEVNSTDFGASKHSAFKRLYPRWKPKAEATAATPEVAGKHARSGFSVSELLSVDTRERVADSAQTLLPAMIGNPERPTGVYPDPRIVLSEYWIKYMRTVQNSAASPYLPMFPQCFFGTSPLGALRSYAGVPPNPCGSHVPVEPNDLRSCMRRSAANTSARIASATSEANADRPEAEVPHSDDSDEQEVRPTSGGGVDPKNGTTSPPSDLDCSGSLSGYRVGPVMTYPVASHHPALLASGMVGFPVSNRRPRDPTKPPPTKKYKCDLCGKAFSRSNTLVTHRRIHTGEKPFKCEICSRAFRQPGNLTRHRLTHTTVKPYVCPICRKAFNRASNLHTHMRTHANFKPFPCHLCGKGFQENVDLRIHLYTHAGKGH